MAKSSAMYAGVVALWAFCVAWFMPRFAALWGDLDSGLVQALLVFVLVCLAIFWFYGIHFWAFFLFTHLERRRRQPAQPEQKPQADSRVAVLYATADDFEYRAAFSCVTQRYLNFHVFLLDDSRRDEYRTKVDAFNREFPQFTTVVRRGNREGFKAGNLNNAVAMVGSDHELFAICDSDTVLPPNFLAELTPYFQEDARLGFAQASQRSNKLSEAPFVRDLERIVDGRWQYHNLPRNRYGLALCLGRGVVLRTEAWRKAGGFPHIVSEDIGLTLSMRRLGYYGRFVPDVICGDGIPPSLATWRKRHFRTVVADLECLFKSGVPFVASKGVTLVEKVGALANILHKPLSGLALPFLVASSFVLLSSDKNSAAIGLMTQWQFLLLNLLVAGGAYLRFLAEVFRQPVAVARFISDITALHISFLLLSTLGLFTYGLARRAHFSVTAAQAGSDRPGKGTGLLSSLAGLNPNQPTVLATETLLAFLLAYVAVATVNWVMLAVSLSLVIMLLRHRLGWEWLPGRVLMHVPALLVLLGAISGLAGIPGLPGQLLLLAALSVLVYS